MADWDSDEQLGYGRPPPWTQFRKGQSGNPKGRPKKKRDVEVAPMGRQAEILRKEIDRKITITEGGEAREISIQEAITKAQTAQALKGSPLAQREIVNRIDRLEADEELKRQAREEAEREAYIEKVQSDEHVFQYMVAVKQSQAKAWAEAKANGKKEPDFPWPHPEDIMIDDGRRQYRLRGPYSEEEVPLYRFMRAERDLAFARMTEKSFSEEADATAWTKIWYLFTRFHDAKLPLRWQIEKRLELHSFRLLVLTDRQLRKEIERREQEAETWRRIAKVERTAESYRVANDALWPLLHAGGYRSLAHFEKACAATDGKPPWPRKPNKPARLG